MKFIAPLLAAAALAAPASAQDYRVDVFGGTSSTDALFFNNPPADYAVTFDGFYGISVDRLDVFTSGLDIGLEYTTLDYTYTNFAPNNVTGQSLLLTATYNYEVAPAFDVYGTAGLGIMSVAYTNGLGTARGTTSAGMVGIGARYSFDTFSVFGEYRHQGVFEDADVDDFGIPNSANMQGDIFLIGVGFSF